MKKIYLLIVLLPFLTNAQPIEEYEFEGYYLKGQQITGNRTVMMNQPLKITQTDENQFLINITLSSQELFVIGLNYVDHFEFAGTPTYSYEGFGHMSGMPLNYQLESTIDLKDLVRGSGFKISSDDELKDFELHFFYWPQGREEPMMKSNSYFYPVLN